MSIMRLATRGSDLATTQSRWVASAVEAATGISSSLEIICTIGDRRTDVSLAEVGSVGLFTKEVQDAVLDGRADFAVHSLKDLPAAQTPGLVLAGIPQREESRDWLVIREDAYSPSAVGFLPLQEGAKVGTSAARRLAFLRHFSPQAESCLLRGNVPTRLAKLAAGDYDAILLAGAGLRRLELNLSAFRVEKLDPLIWPGAPGQGALALECRADDAKTHERLASIHHAESADGVEVERSLLCALGGGCGLPLGATAICSQEGIHFVAALGETSKSVPGEFSGILFRADVFGQHCDEVVEQALGILNLLQEN